MTPSFLPKIPTIVLYLFTDEIPQGYSSFTYSSIKYFSAAEPKTNLLLAMHCLN